MADVDDADARLHLLEHEGVEPLDVLRAERRRGLVQQERLRPRQQRFCDLEELSLRQWE